jgi:hypothetical protein
MLANGWLTRFQKFDWDDGMDIYGPLWLFMVIVHIIFGALSFIDRDAYHKYHDFDNWVGLCLIGCKLVFIAVFFYFYQFTVSKIPSEAKAFYN